MPSAPEQLAFLLEKKSGSATDLQAEITALQVKVQHLYTRAGGEEAAEDDGDEVEEEDAPPIAWLQDEILCIVVSQLDAKTLMVSVPQVCKLWRALCQDIQDVHLDFSWWRGIIAPPGTVGDPKIPAEVFAGWRQAPLTAGGGLKTGLCELFPRTTSSI